MTDYSELVKALRSASTVSTAWEKLMHDAAAAIEELQAQLPKRGEWIHGREIGKEWAYDHWIIYYEDWHCSNCKVVFEQDEKPKYNYCPNCGAKMGVQIIKSVTMREGDTDRFFRKAVEAVTEVQE